MERIQIEERLIQIKEEGERLKRRIRTLEENENELINSMIDKPWAHMEKQNKLIEEWNAEIDQLNMRLQKLREDYIRLNNRVKNTHLKQH